MKQFFFTVLGLLTFAAIFYILHISGVYTLSEMDADIRAFISNSISKGKQLIDWFKAQS